MKSTMRAVVPLGLVAALFTAINVGLAAADDGSPEGVVEVRTPHPCSIAANLRRQWESEKEILDRFEDIKNDALSDYEEKQDLIDEAEARVEELNAQILALELDIIDEFEDLPGFWLDASDASRLLGTSFADFLGGLLDFYRNDPYHAHWATTEEEDRLEERLNELRSLLEDRHDAIYDLAAAIADRDAAREQYEKANDKWRDELSDFRSTEASYERAQRECNLTRSYMSFEEHWHRLHAPDNRTEIDGSWVGQMQNPIGSVAKQPSNETTYVIPFGILQQEQPPQAASGRVAMSGTQTATVTPSRARLFDKLPEGSASGTSPSTPAATGQVMQVEQTGSANTGTGSFGFTHMPIPQTAEQWGKAVAPPAQSLRLIPPTRRISVHPGRSFKR